MWASGHSLQIPGLGQCPTLRSTTRPAWYSMGRLHQGTLHSGLWHTPGFPCNCVPSVPDHVLSTAWKSSPGAMAYPGDPAGTTYPGFHGPPNITVNSTTHTLSPTLWAQPPPNPSSTPGLLGPHKVQLVGQAELGTAVGGTVHLPLTDRRADIVGEAAGLLQDLNTPWGDTGGH